jgi:Ca2+/Na+ antiporter
MNQTGYQLDADSKQSSVCCVLGIGFLLGSMQTDEANYIVKIYLSVFYFLTCIVMLSDFLVLWNLHVYYYHDGGHAVL